MVTFHSLLSLLVLAALHGGISRAAECHGKVSHYMACIQSPRFIFYDSCKQPDPNAKLNLNPIQTDPPKFIKQVKNGKLYSVGSGEDMIYLVHVWGKGSLHV